RAAAGDDDDLGDLPQLLGSQPHLVQGQRAVHGDPAEQRVRDRTRLFGDLLEHEVVIAALLRGGSVPVHVVFAHLGRGTVVVGDSDRVGPQLDHLVLAQFDGVAGVRDERGHVAGKEVLSVATADDQRGVAARGYHQSRVVFGDRDQGEGALKTAAHRAHSRTKVAVVLSELLAEHVGDDFGVGFGAELAATLLQLHPQLREVLDDAVVDHRHTVHLVYVGVGVAVGGRTVGGPAGVADADAVGGTRIGLQRGTQVRQLAGPFLRLEFAVTEHCNSRGVV